MGPGWNAQHIELHLDTYLQSDTVLTALRSPVSKRCGKFGLKGHGLQDLCSVYVNEHGEK